MVAAYYGLTVAELKSPRRIRRLAEPRAVAMYLARKRTSASYPELGRVFGRRHHTTVINAVEKIHARLEGGDAGMRDDIGMLTVALESRRVRSAPSDTELVRTVVECAGEGNSVPTHRWRIVADVFSIGDEAARDLCARFGLDPWAMRGGRF